METAFLVEKNFKKENIYSGYLCRAIRENDKFVIRALCQTVGSFVDGIFFDFISQEEYKQINIENRNKEEGIYFIYPEKLYVKKREIIRGNKVSPIEVFKDFEMRNPDSYLDIKKRVR